MPGLLHQSHQDYIDERRKRDSKGTKELVDPTKLRPCKKCNEMRLLTNQGLCYDCLYLDSH